MFSLITRSLIFLKVRGYEGYLFLPFSDLSTGEKLMVGDILIYKIQKKEIWSLSNLIKTIVLIVDINKNFGVQKFHQKTIGK